MDLRARLVTPFPSGLGPSCPQCTYPNGARGGPLVERSEGTELAKLSAEISELTRYADAQEQKVAHLELALVSRVVIEQAVGMLAERFQLSVDDAFQLLRGAARDARRDLRALAAEVIASRLTPDEIVAARAKG